ncbi:SPOR domain-containing protein [Salinicola sp. RZ23]|uniref:SPOR domain-containing protein n=1 Tax=Salinicola sp. RZ23 TaxID=1949087 RepID=UPI000DA1E1BD|nr:SPOR domain-containing protein [Salinicola sp. RZ23]
MKYGWRERISGAVILVALGAIFVPMLFDDPEPRQQGPEPVMVIEQPVGGGEARQRIIEAPQPPASVAQRDSGGNTSAVPEPDTSAQLGGGGESFGQGAGSTSEEKSGNSQATQPRTDPIAELAQSDTSQPAKRQATASQAAPAKPEPAPSTPTRTAASKDGGWVVQVGSFGQKDNATRLAAKLKNQGFAAYSQPRDNNLTSVYVGPFASSEAGEKARAELKQSANLSGLLIRKPGS